MYGADRVLPAIIPRSLFSSTITTTCAGAAGSFTGAPFKTICGKRVRRVCEAPKKWLPNTAAAIAMPIATSPPTTLITAARRCQKRKTTLRRDTLPRTQTRRDQGLRTVFVLDDDGALREFRIAVLVDRLHEYERLPALRILDYRALRNHHAAIARYVDRRLYRGTARRAARHAAYHDGRALRRRIERG